MDEIVVKARWVCPGHPKESWEVIERNEGPLTIWYHERVEDCSFRRLEEIKDDKEVTGG